jgi:predicted aspartyl protease
VAALYRWVDSAGVVHYTSDRAAIPEEYRESAQEVGHPTARDPQPLASAGPGDVVSIRMGAPIVVEAHLNGVPLRLLVDTGADRTMISPAALGRAGIDVRTGTPIRITGVTGSAVAPLIVVERLDIASAQLGPLAVVAHAVPEAGLDGLLGRDVLEAFTVTVDAAGNRAILAPR